MVDMAVRYLLIKHLSLGYGVLLKRESNDIGKVYFAESGTRSVVLSHPYLSVADNLSLNKFVSLGLYEGLFDSDTKERSKEYIDNRIKNLHLSEKECYGSIIGTHEYSFRILIDSNSFITLSCTCPVEGVCKHLYAVFVNIKKLIDPKNNDAKLSAANENDNEFKMALERFLYVRGADNLALVNKINYQIRSYEKAKLFIETLYPFYQRGQYKARTINDILAPLYFNKANLANFDKALEEVGEDIVLMLQEAKNYYQTVLLKDYERKNSETKKANLYNILLAPNCDGLVSLLNHAEENYSEERVASQVMVEFLKYNDLTIEEIAALKSCYIFQMNHRYYMADLMSSPAKNRLSIYLLFFDELPLDENKIKQIPLEYFLKVAAFSNDKSHYIQIAYNAFDSIKENEIPLLAELLVGVSLQHDYVDERTIRLTIELSKKITNGTYIQEVVDNNIRRPKKAKVH